MRNNDFGTSLSGHSVIIKKISLPTMSAEELAESIRWEAEQYVPFDINDVNLDYVVLDASGGETMDVLLVAVKKDKIGDYTSVITQVGKTPALVDVDAFALQNAYEINYPIEPGRVVALVNIGASVTNVNVLSGSNTIFWRDISFGGNQYTDAIQKQLSLGFEQAEALKKGEASADYSMQDILPILRSVSEDLAQELQKTFDFFIATTSTEKIDQIFIAGGSSRVVNLDTQLKERFGIPVEIMNPFRQIDIAGSSVSSEWLTDNAPSLAIAVGLAARHIETRRLDPDQSLTEAKAAAARRRPLLRRERSSTTCRSSRGSPWAFSPRDHGICPMEHPPPARRGITKGQDRRPTG